MTRKELARSKAKEYNKASKKRKGQILDAHFAKTPAGAATMPEST